MNAYITSTGTIGHANYTNPGSSGQVGAMNATGHGSNTNQSGQTYSNIPINPIGATGHGSNTNQSGQVDTTGHSNSTSAEGQISNKPTTSPTDAVSHGSTVYSGGQVENKPTINLDAVGHKPTEEKKAIPDLYMQDGDDYYINDNALSNAQMKTGDDEKADSVVGSGSGDSSETNSNINTGVFGGSARAAHPGYSLW